MKENSDKKYFISIPEAARRYSAIGRNKLYELVKAENSQIPHIKINSVVKINVPLFEEWLEEASKKGLEL